MAGPRLKAGIWYYPTWAAAVAALREIPDTAVRDEHRASRYYVGNDIRLNPFSLGWAIQLHQSGPYWGPDGWG